MPRASDIPLHKKTLNLYEGDYERLRDLYPDIDAADVIRRLIRTHIEKLEREHPAPEINLNLR